MIILLDRGKGLTRNSFLGASQSNPRCPFLVSIPSSLLPPLPPLPPSPHLLGSPRLCFPSLEAHTRNPTANRTGAPSFSKMVLTGPALGHVLSPSPALSAHTLLHLRAGILFFTEFSQRKLSVKSILSNNGPQSLAT